MKNKWQTISVAGLALLIIIMAAFDMSPSISILFATLILISLPDIYNWAYNSQLILSILSKLFEKRVIAYANWLNENAKGNVGNELDLTNAPWLPPILREYWMRKGGLLEIKRYLEKQQQSDEGSKKKTKRGHRGSGNRT